MGIIWKLENYEIRDQPFRRDLNWLNNWSMSSRTRISSLKLLMGSKGFSDVSCGINVLLKLIIFSKF